MLKISRRDQKSAQMNNYSFLNLFLAETKIFQHLLVRKNKYIDLKKRIKTDVHEKKMKTDVGTFPLCEERNIYILNQEQS